MKKIITSLTFMFAVVYCNAQWTILEGDSTSFPANSAFAHIDTTAGNIWQIGLPQKTFFDTAHSVPYAIMTDTINPYPVNNLSTFTVEFTDSVMWGIGDAYIGFWHKYEMDSLKDGGYVEISLDSGATWLNNYNCYANNVFVFDQINFYDSFLDTIQGNIPAFTGTHNTWEYSAIKFQWVIPVMPTYSGGDNKSPYNCPKVMFRFNFKSDSIQTNKAGWIIDDLAIRIYDIGSGINENHQSSFNVEVFPNPINEHGILQAVSFHNEKDFTISIYNSLGQEIKTTSLDKNNQYIIKANELTSGIYFYSIRNKIGEQKNGKIIIK